jgi:hypothetical protein
MVPSALEIGIYLTKVGYMHEGQLQQVRRFNRLVTQRVGALEVDYLRRGRPLAEARLIFEISADGADVRTLRSKLNLDSGYLSRPEDAGLDCLPTASGG